MRLTVNEILRSGADARLPVGHPGHRVRGRLRGLPRAGGGRPVRGLRGELADGGQHAPDALRDGAAAAVVGESAWRWIEGDAQGMRRPVMVSPDPLAVLQAAGSWPSSAAGPG